MDIWDIIVIGAGPAGMAAAARAGEQGAKVLLLEKMNREGRKLIITGKGRCNITNSADIPEFITHVFPNGRFLRSAFANYFSEDILAMLKKYGVESVLERGGRYFPASGRSIDVLNAFLLWLRDSHIERMMNAKAEEILVENGQAKGVSVNGKKLFAKKVILATGGKSYQGTGSTGDGYKLAKEVGHSLTPPQPALVSLLTDGHTAQDLQGLNLRNVNAVIWVDGKKAGEKFGEMLFTHFGLSGPIILTLSRTAVAAMRLGQKVDISIDLKPALDDQKLDARLLRDLNEHGKMQLDNVFRFWLPASMVPIFINLLKLDPTKPCGQVSAEERKRIRVLMKNFTFHVTGDRGYSEAIITAGGIPTNEISQKTMESKIVKGLYFAGEVIDLDAETGGYNLQIAYSTGVLAADSAVRQLNSGEQ